MSGVKISLCVSPQNSEYFEYRHIGQKKIFGVNTFSQNLKLEKDGFENFGGSGGEGGGSGIRTGRPPWLKKQDA